MALMKTIKVIMAIKVKFTHLFICNLDLDDPDENYQGHHGHQG